MTTRNVNVGVFAIRQVPVKMQGTSILYAPDLRKFAVIDRNTKERIALFEMPQYRKFADAGVIEFDRNTQDYIEDEYQKWYDEQRDALDKEVAEDAEGDEPSIIAPGDRSNVSQEDAKVHVSKDPTRHVGGYFITVSTVAILIILARLVIVPLVIKLFEIA